MLTFKLPPIPTPPVTTKAPVVVFEEPVAAVTAKPDTDNISVDGLNDKVVSLETAEPDEDAIGVNKIEWDKFDEPAPTTLIFWEVVAVPIDPTQVKVPDVSDCNTDVPVPGNAIGKVYVVLDAFAPALRPV